MFIGLNGTDCSTRHSRLYRLAAVQAMWAVLGVMVRHNGHLKSGVVGGKRDDTAPEAQLVSALTAGKPGSSYILLSRPPAEHVLHSAAIEVQQLLLLGRQSEALR